MESRRKIRVLIVDDSLALCRFLQATLSRDAALEVVDYALDAYEAREKIKLYNPDVLTLDVEMPRMDGLTFLKNLMRLHPMPVVMLSSLTAAGAAVTLDALQEGAVDFMVKRHPGSDAELESYTEEIVERVKQAGQVNVHAYGSAIVEKPLPDLTHFRRKLKASSRLNSSLSRVVAIGASTGGPEALRQVLNGFDASSCALLIVQHMPERYMGAFARRLDSYSSFDIRIAETNEKVVAGRGYVAPGDHHLEVVRKGQGLVCITRRSEVVLGHRPSVDVLFSSVADNAGKSGVGLLLTGMGEDGAEGLKKMRNAGALTVVQDKKSSAVWGMPGRAFELGGADGMMGLQQISPSLNALLGKVA
ncbi:MAG: chemotaxis response regulator protein-glutamate methylesterase [Granulosicoccus sp.]